MAEPASLGLERRNPLPAGRYWVFRIGARAIVDFDAWLTKNRANVKLRNHELDPSAEPQTSFNVFEVLQSGVTMWEGPGLPDRSPPHVTSSQDVQSGPVVLDLPERARQAAEAATRGAESIPTLLFFFGALWLLSQGNDS